MGCNFRVRKQNSNKGCIYFSDKYCTSVDAQYYRCPIAIASGNYKNIYLSKSQKDSWERCPEKWKWEQIIGLKVKERKTALPLRQGSEIGRLLALHYSDKKTIPADSELLVPTYFATHEQYYLELIHIIVEIIIEHEMLPMGAEWEVKAERNNLSGYLDLTWSNHFGELKYGQRPSWYLTSPIARNQLEFYCYLRPDMKNAHMLPIRSPGLKDKIDEDFSGKLKRTEEDIRKKMNHYFPYYDKDRNGVKWGRSWSHYEWKSINPKTDEFDMWEFEQEIDWTRREIQMACQHDYFIRKRSLCTSPGDCSFLPILKTGSIDWNYYTRRDRDAARG